MSVTINDVAKEAGVSITTVSRVLNNNYPVKKETRENIEKAIEKLKYRPNVMARGLITKKTSQIGIIVPGITNLFFSTIVEDIEKNIKEKGYSITLCNTGGNIEEEKNLVFHMISRQVDGIVVIDPCIENLSEGFYDEIATDVPLIVVNGLCESSNCNSICYDEEKGTKEAFKYLMELNHRNIVFIRGNRSLSYDIKEKVYREFIKENHISYKKILNVGEGNSIEVVEKTEHEFERFIKETQIPTAVFACNDLMALGVLNICTKHGINIPEDISIVGFDNTLLSVTTRPKLTTVDENMKKVAEHAAINLLNIIENNSKNTIKINLPTKLVIRQSCSKAKK